MGTSAWKDSLLDLRARLSSLHHGGHTIHHRLMASTLSDPLQHVEICDNLTVELRCSTVQGYSDVTTSGLESHRHIFYSPSERSVEAFTDALDGLEANLAGIPAEVLPNISPEFSKASSNNRAALWMAVVLHTAWEADAIYLPASVECMLSLDDEGTTRWSAIHQPFGADPRDWLIHLPGASPVDLMRKFQTKAFSFPKLIFCYLEEDAIRGSVAAIDVLVHILGNSVEQSVGSISRKNSSRSRKKSSRLTTGYDVYYLTELIKAHHKPRYDGDSGRPPMSQQEIMDQAEWKQSKVSRTMAKIFGDNPVKAYRSSWFRGGFDEVKNKLENSLTKPIDPAKD